MPSLAWFGEFYAAFGIDFPKPMGYDDTSLMTNGSLNVQN